MSELGTTAAAAIPGGHPQARQAAGVAMGGQLRASRQAAHFVCAELQLRGSSRPSTAGESQHLRVPSTKVVPAHPAGSDSAHQTPAWPANLAARTSHSLYCHNLAGPNCPCRGSTPSPSGQGARTTAARRAVPSHAHSRGLFFIFVLQLP